MLSGAVVASGSGVSAIYYNPAAIAKATNTRLSLNTDVITLETIKLENIFGRNLISKVTNLKVHPSFVSLLLKDKKHPRLIYEFAILTREDSRIQINEGIQGQADAIPGIPGDELSDIRMELQFEYSDLWFGGGAGYQVNDHLSLGLSTFIIVRSGSYKYFADVNAFPPSDTVLFEGEPVPFFSSNISNRESFRYTQFRMIWKAGLLYDKDTWAVGLNITTPSYALPIFESSEASGKISQSNVFDREGQPVRDLIIVDQQEKRPVNFKDPFSIAAGLRFSNADRSSNIYATLEYFAGLSPYKTFDAGINPNITTEEIFEQLPNKDFLTRFSAAKPILNTAIGYRRRLSEDISLSTGFRTDFNYLKDYDFSDKDPLLPKKELNMNVYHITGGALFRIRNSFFILGIQYSFGKDNRLPRILDIQNPGLVPDDDINGFPPKDLPKDMIGKYRSISTFVGFNIRLGGDAD